MSRKQINPQPRSRNRTEYRKVEEKFLPTIKGLSTHLHNTGDIPSKFRGYKAPAGTLTDRRGREWQIQVSAVCAKKDFMRKDEIRPFFKKWAIDIYVKSWAINFINKVFNK